MHWCGSKLCPQGIWSSLHCREYENDSIINIDLYDSPVDLINKDLKKEISRCYNK